MREKEWGRERKKARESGIRRWKKSKERVSEREGMKESECKREGE